MDIGLLQTAVGLGKVKITEHAEEEAWSDTLSLADIYTAVLDGEVIEDYPTDKPYPSCLVLGRAASGDPIHSVWAYNNQTDWLSSSRFAARTQIGGLTGRHAGIANESARELPGLRRRAS